MHYNFEILVVATVSNVLFFISKAKYYDIDLERILEIRIDFSSEKYSGGKGKTVVWYHGMCGIRLVPGCLRS